MPPFVAKAVNAAGTELELPAKVQELLAGQTPSSILPHDPVESSGEPLSGPSRLLKHCIPGMGQRVVQLTCSFRVIRHMHKQARA